MSSKLFLSYRPFCPPIWVNSFLRKSTMPLLWWSVLPPPSLVHWCVISFAFVSNPRVPYNANTTADTNTTTNTEAFARYCLSLKNVKLPLVQSFVWCDFKGQYEAKPKRAILSSCLHPPLVRWSQRDLDHIQIQIHILYRVFF